MNVSKAFSKVMQVFVSVSHLIFEDFSFTTEEEIEKEEKGKV